MDDIIKHMELQKIFCNLYCAKYLVDSIEGDIDEYIKNILPLDIVKKIHTIGVDMDYEDFMILEISVDNRYFKEVYCCVKKYFKGWDWYTDRHNNFSDICLRLDDDVVARIPSFMFDNDGGF